MTNTTNNITEELGYSKVFSINIETSNGTETITDDGLCQHYLNADLDGTDEAWYQFWERLCDYTGSATSLTEITTNGYSKG